MSKNQKLNLALLTLINTWMIVIPFYGIFFNRMVSRSGNNINTAQFLCLSAYQLSIIGATFIFREGRIKRLMYISLPLLILTSSVMWYFTAFQGIAGYIALGALSGLVRALFCHYIIYGFKPEASIRIIGFTFLGAYFGIYCFKYITLLLGMDIAFAIATLLLIGAWVLNLYFEEEELVKQASVTERSYPLKPVLFIGFVCFLALFCNGLIRNTFYPRTVGVSTGLGNYLEYIPEIAVFLVVCIFSRRIDRLLLVNCSVAVIGVAYLCYILQGGSNLAANILVDLSIAAYDVFLYSAIVDFSRQYGRNYNAFRTVMLVFTLGALAGDFIGKTLAVHASGDYIFISVVMLSVIFMYVFALPWINKHIQADFIQPHEKKNTVLQLVPPTQEHSNDQMNENCRELLLLADSRLPEGNRLTAREIEIAALILERYDNETIANKLFISQNTLKVHIRHIYQKFDISKRKEFIEKVDMMSRQLSSAN